MALQLLFERHSFERNTPFQLKGQGKNMLKSKQISLNKERKTRIISVKVIAGIYWI
jgi:hypothetical protein